MAAVAVTGKLVMSIHPRFNGHLAAALFHLIEKIGGQRIVKFAVFIRCAAAVGDLRRRTRRQTGRQRAVVNVIEIRLVDKGVVRPGYSRAVNVSS